MTSGERMVWAIEFARQLAIGARHTERGALNAACSATSAVHALRETRDAAARRGSRDVPDEVLEMLEDMLGVPR